MENMQGREQAQALVYQFKYLKDQRDMFAQQLEIINASLSNLLNTKNTVENLKNIEEGEEILIPIGGMVALNANIKNTKKVLLYVNQDVVIEKDLDGSIEFIDKLIAQHNEQIQFVSSQIQKLEANLQEMSQMFQNSGFQ